MLILRSAFVRKSKFLEQQLARNFNESKSNNLIPENKITEKPFGSRLPDNLMLNSLQQEKEIYVDKSSSILQLITETKFSLITRPRRFGKSLYLNTIKAIAEKDEAIKLLAIGKKYEDLIKYPVLKFDFSNSIKIYH